MQQNFDRGVTFDRKVTGILEMVPYIYRIVWWMVQHFLTVFLENRSNSRCNMWMSIVMENGHTIFVNPFVEL